MYKTDRKELVINTIQHSFVFVSATWYKSCKQIRPLISELENEYAKTVEFVELDYDDTKEFMKELKIDIIPSVIFYNNSRIKEIIQGTKPITIYQNLINRKFSK